MDDAVGGIALPAFLASFTGMVLGLASEYFAGPGSFWGIAPWVGALGIMGTGLSVGVLIGVMTRS